MIRLHHLLVTWNVKIPNHFKNTNLYTERTQVALIQAFQIDASFIDFIKFSRFEQMNFLEIIKLSNNLKCLIWLDEIKGKLREKKS